MAFRLRSHVAFYATCWPALCTFPAVASLRLGDTESLFAQSNGKKESKDGEERRGDEGKGRQGKKGKKQARGVYLVGSSNKARPERN